MGWGGLVDVQHNSQYLTLFGLGLGRFFGGPAVSGSDCGGSLRFSFICYKISSSDDTSVVFIIFSKSESLKSESSSSVSNTNSTIYLSFCRDFVRMLCFDDVILEMENSNDNISKKLSLTTLCEAGNYRRDRIEPKFILENKPMLLRSHRYCSVWPYSENTFCELSHH